MLNIIHVRISLTSGNGRGCVFNFSIKTKKTFGNLKTLLFIANLACSFELRSPARPRFYTSSGIYNRVGIRTSVAPHTIESSRASILRGCCWRGRLGSPSLLCGEHTHGNSSLRAERNLYQWEALLAYACAMFGPRQ